MELPECQYYYYDEYESEYDEEYELEMEDMLYEYNCNRD